MNNTSLILGAQLWFAREGESYTLPAPGIVARDSLPGAADSVWAYLGIIGELSVEGDAEEVEVWRPAPGRLVLDDVLHTKGAIKYSFTCRQLGPSGLEFLFRTVKLTPGSNSFTPLAVPQIKGWLKAQWYDQTNSQRLITDNWVVLKPNGALKADAQSLAEVQFEARLLFSTLNLGGIS
jgi:hypothetical protein